MTDRPIPFRLPMVRALLEGRKTQHRAAMRLPPAHEHPKMGGWEATTSGGAGCFDRLGRPVPEMTAIWHRTTGRTICTNIQTGDRLWVKEPITRFDKGTCDQWVWYRAGMNSVGDYAAWNAGCDENGEWGEPEGPAGGKPYNVRAALMPRWASRLTLIVTDVRVQRVQDISEEDAKAEGVTPVLGAEGVPLDRHWVAYNQLWDRLHGPASWVMNPWVAAYSFTVHHHNIDAMPEVTP